MASITHMAGLIPQPFIDDLLNRIDITDVVSARVQLKRSGKNLTACCPFHNEKTPSFSVSADKQLYHCFGCGAGGDAIKFVMEYDHLDFPQAIELLAKQAGLEVTYESQGEGRRGHIDSPLYDLLQRSADFYQQALKNHPTKKVAVDYFKLRGLTGKIAKDFGLGFAPQGWNNLIQHFNADDVQQKLLIDAGLVVEHSETGRRYDRFRERVMFPIRDARGRVIAFGGRVLGNDKPKYLNSPETAIFHKGEVLYGLYEVKKHNRHLDEIIVLEGYMDVIAMAQFGFTNAVATLGTATSEEHIKRLFRVVPSLLFCFDGDQAGRNAAWRALESALSHLQDGRRVRFLFLPEGEDPDTLIRSEGEEAFRARISQQALPLTDYLFKHLMEEASPDTLEGKAHLNALMTPLLTKLPKGAFKRLIQQRLAQITGLDQVQHNVVRTERKMPSPVSSGGVEGSRYGRAFDGVKLKPSVASPVMRAVRQLLLKPSLIEVIDFELVIEVTDDYSYLLAKAFELLKAEPQLNAYQLMGKMIAEDKGKKLQGLLKKEMLINSNENLEKEFKDTILLLRNQQHEAKLDALLKKGSSLTDGEKLQLTHLLKLKAELS